MSKPPLRRGLTEHYASLPLDSRPLERSGPHLERFGHLVAAPYLRPKKLQAKDKKRARKLKHTFVATLALQNDMQVDAAKIDAMLDARRLSREAALGAYAKELLSRCHGVRSTPASLALWREFAWTPQGSPDRKFKLRSKEILTAETELLAVLKA